MKIYMMTVLSPDQSFEFFPTKLAAETRGKEHADEGTQYRVTPWDVEPTRNGISEALNNFVSLTCINEH